MKNKGSSSLYEVLKSASRPGADPAPAPSTAPEASASADGQMTLQARLAAYKAAKLAEAQSPGASATAVADPTPIPVAVPDPMPVARPAAAPTQILTPIFSAPAPVEARPETDARPAAGPGERVFRLTFNTAAFAALVTVGLLFVAYALGVRVGRSRAAEAPETAVDRAAAGPRIDVVDTAPPRPPVAPQPPRQYTIHLIEWPARRPEERLKAADLADQYKKALEKQGFKGVETVKITRAGEERLAMYIDRFKETAAEPARTRLSSLQKVKIANQTPFAQAGFEEVPR